MGLNQGRRSVEQQRSAVILPTRGGSTTCTATRSSGAATGITRNCLEGLIRIYMRPQRLARRANMEAAHVCAEVVVGRTTVGLADPPFDCGSSRNGATTT